MASNPAMLLDPKGAKRQAQRNGNDPNSFPSHHSLPMDSLSNEAGEPPTDSPGHLDRHSNHALPLASDLLEVPFSASLFPPMDTSGNIGEEAEAATEICTPAISLDSLQVIPTDAPVPPEDDGDLLPQVDSEILVGTFPVPVDSATDLDLDMECAAGPTDEHAPPEDDVNLLPQVDSETQIGTFPVPADSATDLHLDMECAARSPEPFPLDTACVSHDPQSDATTKLEEPTELAEPPNSVSEFPLRSLPVMDTLPPMAQTSSAEPECPGLLLDHTGKQSMAPAGTATVTQRREPTPRTPITINSTASSPAPQSMGNLEVQFSTAQDDENESDAKRSYHELSDDEDKPDQRNLIADVYGAEQRKRQPVKRVKTANEQSSAANTQISIAGSNGLGKWMKEGEEGPTPSTAFDTVDLTKDLADTTKEDEDDEIECTGSTDLSTQRVCYGKIDGALIQASFVPKPTDSSFFIDENSWPSMKVELRRPANIRQGDTQINVVDPHNFIFGKIDAKTAQGLCPLLDDTAISTVDVTARLNTRRRYLGESVWAPTSGFWHATINVYGQRQRADGIGRFLAHRNVWLGTPNSVENGTPTFNPHAELRRQHAAAAAVASTSRERLGPTIRYETRTAEEVHDAVTKMFDQLIKSDIPTMEPSPHILTPLLHHQKQALWFMTDKEQPRKFGPREKDNNSLWRESIRADGKRQYKEIISGIVMDQKPPEALGGLLADMMGLGKTLSILSLITSSLDQANEWTELAPSPHLVRDVPGIRNTRTTLIVAPLSAVSNWSAQIRDHLKPRSLSVCVFHGPTRTNDLDELSDHDIVITTYSTIHSEILGRGAKTGKISPLTRMNMFRIVLDEAHTIRERNAAQTRAILSLHAERRWSVTGTPIQNRMDDLFSVTNFLQIYPYSERAWFSQHISGPVKSGNPSLTNLRVIVDSFTLRRVKDKINLPPRDEQIVMLNFNEKEKQLHDFFRSESQVMMRVIAGEDKTKMGGRMYHHVLKAMMILRQVSAHGKELLDTSDRDRAKGLSPNDAIDLEEAELDENAGAIDKKAYSMFQLMLAASTPRCSQCNETLQESLTSSGEVATKVPQAFFLPCWDVFCPSCFSGYKPAFDSGIQNELRCPSCDGWIANNYSAITPAGLASHEAQEDLERQTRKLGKNFGDYEGPHTKTVALVNYLLDTVEQSKELVGQPPIKSVVFSAWTSHLDLIEIALNNSNLSGFTRLDGTMTLTARTRALERFATDDSVTILLATIGAGGVGLNLTSASQVFIMEPQYNPAAVAQAVDRVHRLGQTRPVRIYQLIMKESIEEKILELAQKKQREADMTMNRQKLGKKEVQEARMREYRTLFK